MLDYRVDCSCGAFLVSEDGATRDGNAVGEKKDSVAVSDHIDFRKQKAP